MRVLLDECLPRRLRRSLPGHEVATVPEVGWAGRSNGELLALDAARFDVFITVNGNLTARPPRAAKGIGIIALRAAETALGYARYTYSSPASGNAAAVEARLAPKKPDSTPHSGRPWTVPRRILSRKRNG